MCICCRHSHVAVPSVVGAATSQKNVQLRNVMSMLRQCTNHPYLIEYPLTSDGNFRVDEQLVEVSGKLLMLDAMLRELKLRGHKVSVLVLCVCACAWFKVSSSWRAYKVTVSSAALSL